MPNRINGASSAQQDLTGSLQFYVVYFSSPGAFSDPDANPPPAQEDARLLNVLITEDIRDQSQKNFEIFFQAIGLRAVPVIMNNTIATVSLSAEDAPTLTGEGFVWKFATERDNVWHDYNNNNPVGLLITEIDGVIIESGVRVTTVDGSPTGVPKNIEFTIVDHL